MDSKELDPSSLRHIIVNVNLAALHGKYVTALQRLLDSITYIFAGAEALTDDQYNNYTRFFNINPASNQRLEFNSAKIESEKWLIKSFLGDAINLTGAFLEECNSICTLYRLHTSQPIKSEDFNRIFNEEGLRFNSHSLPKKFKELRNEFGVSSPFEGHVLSLNRIRNCLVHRLGSVTKNDVDSKGELTITWRTIELFATNPDKSDSFIIDGPEKIVPGGWTISMRVCDKQKTFKVGDKIELNYEELYNSVLTFFAFASTIVKSIDEYSVKLGVSRNPSENNQV